MVKTRDMRQIVQTTGGIIFGTRQQIRPPWINRHTTELTEDSITTNNDVIRLTNGVESSGVRRILNDATNQDTIWTMNTPMNHGNDRRINNAMNHDANWMINNAMNRDVANRMRNDIVNRDVDNRMRNDTMNPDVDNRRRSDNMNIDTSLGRNDAVNHDVIIEIDDNPEMNNVKNHNRRSIDTTKPEAILKNVNRLDDRQAANEPMEALQQNSENITITTTEAKRRISKHIDSIWQHQWNESTKGNDYRMIEPLVSRKLKITQFNRGREVIATRLRFGKCSLNFYLNIVGKHATGYCSRCHVPETIEHFILQCPQNLELAMKLTEQCQAENIGLEITNVLKNDKTMEIIIDYVIKIKRKI